MIHNCDHTLEGIWVVTIHDCLVTHPEQVERVKQIMVPTIKLTSYDSSYQVAFRSDRGTRAEGWEPVARPI